MTRFARAKGSKSSNKREPEEATPWIIMKQGLLNQKQNNNIEKAEELQKQKATLNSLKEESTVSWSAFDEDIVKCKVDIKDMKKDKKTKKNKETLVEKIILNGEDYNECVIETIEKNYQKKKKNETNNFKEHETTFESKTYLTSYEDSITNESKKRKKKNTVNQNDGKHENEEETSEGSKKKKKKKQNTVVQNDKHENEQETSEESKKKKKKKKKKQNTVVQNNKHENEVETSEENKEKKKQNSVVQNDKHENEEETSEEHSVRRNRKRKKKIVKNESSNNESLIKKIRNTENCNNASNYRDVDKEKNGSKFPVYNKTENKKKFKNRRKSIPEPISMNINGIQIDIVRYDGFPVKKEDAERLDELKKKLFTKGIPRDEIKKIMKLQRRNAEKALSRTKKHVCFNCRKSGHNLSECPELNKGEGTGICFKCGSTEHTHFECKVTKKLDFKFAHCFICKEQGHISNQCPDNPRGLYPKGGACKLCGDVTHLKRFCPTLPKQTDVTIDEFLDGPNNSEPIATKGSFKTNKKHVRF